MQLVGYATSCILQEFDVAVNYCNQSETEILVSLFTRIIIVARLLLLSELTHGRANIPISL